MGLKVGVIGVGHLGRHHARIYSEMEGVELTAVVDADHARARDIARQYGGSAYADFREALDGLAALSIATPTSDHYAIALECLRARKDLLIEKPITLTVREADTLIEEADKRGCIIQVGHLERYNPAVTEAARHVRDAWFFEAERVSPFLNRATDVDVTIDLMIHDIDIVLGFLGGAGVSKLSAAGNSIITDKLDFASAWLEFKNGVSAVFTASRISEDTRRCLRIYQKDSYMALDYRGKTLRRYFKADGGFFLEESIPVKEGEPLKEELMDFAACVIQRRRPKVSGVEARDALELTIRITERIKERL